MDGRLAYTNYQLMNTLAITPSGMEQLLDASLYHLYKIYNSAMHLRYQINYLSETEPDDFAVMTADNYRRKVVMEMLFRTPEFEHTEFYKDLKTDVVYYFKRRLKKGRVLVNGNNQTIFGNPYEFLCAVTDKSYEPTEPMLLGDGEVYTKRFEDGEKLTCARNPHITLGNILIGVNRIKEEIDTYFNLTKDIVCANAINSNLQIEKNNTATLNCPMSIIYDFVTKYEPYRLPKRKVKLSDLFVLEESDGDSNDYHRKKNIIVAVQKAEDDIRYLHIRESKAQGDAKAILRAEMQTILDECLKVVARNASNDHVLGLLLRELDSGEKKEISQIKSFLFACLLFEKNGRLLSKVKTPEDYHYTELKLATDENVERDDMIEIIYGHPHVIVVDGDTVLGSHGKIELVDGKVIHYDANGNRVPLSILDY